LPAEGVVMLGEAEVEEAAFSGVPLPQRRVVGEMV
jgi:Cd2+/Zn2+-exporting ATPase